MERRSFLKLGALVGATGVVGHAEPVSAESSSVKLTPTPKEIEGPFYPIIAQQDKDFDLTKVEGKEGVALGEQVFIEGRVTDEDGVAIEGALVDIWQANSHGRYRHPNDPSEAPLDENFQGWAMVNSGKEGSFRFKTIIPGAYAVSSNWKRPPHIHYKVSKRGFNELVTQMYFSGQKLNDIDRLLLSKSKVEQKVMIAELSDKKHLGVPVYVYHVVLKQVV